MTGSIATADDSALDVRKEPTAKDIIQAEVDVRLAYFAHKEVEQELGKAEEEDKPYLRKAVADLGEVLRETAEKFSDVSGDPDRLIEAIGRGEITWDFTGEKPVLVSSLRHAYGIDGVRLIESKLKEFRENSNAGEKGGIVEVGRLTGNMTTPHLFVAQSLVDELVEAGQLVAKKQALPAASRRS